MGLIGWCVRYPVSVAVGMILTVLFGVISLYRIPLQMTPTVDRPEITVETDYLGAAPQEVEQEVTDRQEERLNSVEGLAEITSSSTEGRSRIVLKFDWGTNKDLARLDVSEKLDLVQDLPDEAEAPVIRAVNSDEETPIAWIATTSSRPINEVREEVEDVAKARLERVEGVGAVWLFGGQEREVRVFLDPAALAARNLTVSQVRDAIQGENRNTRGGNLDEGRRRYVVRTVGQFDRLDQLRGVIVARQGSAAPVYLADVATVDFGYKEPQGLVRRQGRNTVGMGVLRKTGANTVEVMGRLRAELAYLNRIYADKDLRFEQVYDETVYINEAIKLVTDNIVTGGILAALALLIFLRNVWTVGIMAITIPVGVIATFIFVYAFGRSLNIIMLAGLAFAVGTVMDNSIVVLENVFRHRAMGKRPFEAAVEGTAEVWGSMLASTLTTLAVFVPIIFVEQEAGQLFRDIAIALALVNALSLLVTFTVTPMMAARFLRMQRWDRTPRRARVVDLVTFGWLGRAVASGFERLLVWLNGGVLRRALTATGIVVASVVGAWLLMPPLDYLPQGNRNFIFGIVKTPPGLNLDDKTRMVQEIEGRVLGMPQLQDFFTVVRGEDPFVGAIFKPEHASVRGMQQGLAEFRGRAFGVPGTIGVFVAQVPLFSRAGGGFFGGVNVEVDVRGDSLEEIQRLSGEVQQGLQQLPFVNFVNSSFELGNPEIRVRPDRDRARALGLTAADVGYVVETMVAGSRAGLFRDRGKELDLTLISAVGPRMPTHELGNLNLTAPGGRVLRLADVAAIEPASGPTKIDHTDLDRSITLTANINPTVPLGQAIERIEGQIVAPLRARLPLGYLIDLTGQAQDLAVTFDALKWSFLLAIVIIYLLMCSLYESWSVPFIVMFSVPLAMTGGVLGLKLVNTVEPTVKLDVVTMLGFIILAGVVVNNAILLVDVALQRMAAGADPKAAMLEGATTRLRPIAMTAVAAIIGLLPLVVSSGAGSELYRGLGAVMLGGLALSTVFTLVLIPVLFTLWFDLRVRFAQGLARVWARRPGNGRQPA